MSKVNCCRVETISKFKSTLEAFNSFRNTNRVKKIEKVNLGDVVINASLREYTGTLLLYFELLANNCLLRLFVGDEEKIAIPCGQIVSCNITGTTAMLQFKEDFYIEKCTIHFYGKDQVCMFEKKLPKIARTESEVHQEVSSDSDFNDSGNEKTSNLNNSFSSSELREHDEME